MAVALLLAVAGCSGGGDEGLTPVAEAPPTTAAPVTTTSTTTTSTTTTAAPVTTTTVPELTLAEAQAVVDHFESEIARAVSVVRVEGSVPRQVLDSLTEVAVGEGYTEIEYGLQQALETGFDGFAEEVLPRSTEVRAIERSGGCFVADVHIRFLGFFDDDVSADGFFALRYSDGWLVASISDTTEGLDAASCG